MKNPRQKWSRVFLCLEHISIGMQGVRVSGWEGDYCREEEIVNISRPDPVNARGIVVIWQ
jgi:hypothetical protein